MSNFFAVSLLSIYSFSIPSLINIFFLALTPSSSYGIEPNAFFMVGSSTMLTISFAIFSPILSFKMDSPETTRSASQA